MKGTKSMKKLENYKEKINSINFAFGLCLLASKEGIKGIILSSLLIYDLNYKTLVHTHRSDIM